MEAIEDVEARLADQGYRQLGPVARRGARYFVRAVDPRGNRVALQISIFTGEIERSRVLQAGYVAPPPALPKRIVKSPAKPAAAPPPHVRPAPAPAPVPAVATAPAPSPSPAKAPASTLKGRLKVPPADAPTSSTAPASPAPSSGGDDPLVVY